MRQNAYPNLYSSKKFCLFFILIINIGMNKKSIKEHLDGAAADRRVVNLIKN
jgi:hypothetical protein